MFCLVLRNDSRKKRGEKLAQHALPTDKSRVDIYFEETIKINIYIIWDVVENSQSNATRDDDGQLNDDKKNVSMNLISIIKILFEWNQSASWDETSADVE